MRSVESTGCDKQCKVWWVVAGILAVTRRRDASSPRPQFGWNHCYVCTYFSILLLNCRQEPADTVCWLLGLNTVAALILALQYGLKADVVCL
jgi:hypothetical protein